MALPGPTRAAAATWVEEAATPGGLALSIRPVRPPAAWLALAWLLAALFGLPALAILLSPQRWDGLSLSAMGCGFAIAGFAALAARRARRTRRPQRLVASAEGVTTPGAVLAWPRIRAIETVSPPAPPREAGTGAAMGLRIAAARVAHEWRVEALLDDGRTALLAEGLDAAAAARIRDRLAAARDASA